MDSASTGLILLAAGQSLRFGRPKQLLKFGSASLIRRACETAVQSGCAPVIVVLGSAEERIRPELTGLRVQVAVNHCWAEGLGTSIHCGVRNLLAHAPHTSNVILMLADQPHVSVETLERLLACHEDHPGCIIASRFSSTLGPPALFPSSDFHSLLMLSGHSGAKDFILQKRDQVVSVDCPEAELDIDTVADALAAYEGLFLESEKALNESAPPTP